MGDPWADKRVLVVEDDLSIRTIVSRMLGSRGATIDTAVDGLEGLDRIREATPPYDVVVTDLGMPGLSGLELLHEIKKIRPRTEVILITAMGDEDSVVEAFRNDAFRYIRKPFSRDDLVRCVDAALREATRRSTSSDEIPTVRTRRAIDAEGRDERWIELTAPSRQEYLDRFQDFCQLLLDSRLDHDSKNRIRIAVQEMGQNAIEWGNRFDDQRRIRIAYRLDRDKIIFRIEDEGEGFDPQLLTDPTLDPIATIERREAVGKRPGGFGIHLVRQVMDKVSYNDKGNVVFLEKNLGGPASEAP